MKLRQHAWIWASPLVTLALVGFVYKPLTLTQAMATIFICVPIIYAGEWVWHRIG